MPAAAIEVTVATQSAYDSALTLAAADSGTSTITIDAGAPLLIQSGTASYPPGLSSGLNLDFVSATLDVGGTGAPGATLTLNAATSLTFSGVLPNSGNPPISGYLRVGHGAAGTLNINGASLLLTSAASGSPGRFIVGGGGGNEADQSVVNMTAGTITFEPTTDPSNANYPSLAIGRSVGPSGTFNQSGGTFIQRRLSAVDIGTVGGVGTFALSGNAVFTQDREETTGGVVYFGSRPDAGTGAVGRGTLSVTDAAQVTFSAGNIYFGDALGIGTLTVSGADAVVTLFANNGVLFGSNQSNLGGTNGGGAGSISLTAGTLNIGGNSVSLSLGHSAGGSGTVTVSGGTLNVTGSPGLAIGTVSGGTGSVTQSGGLVTAERVSFGAGTGSYLLSGGILAAGLLTGGDAADVLTLAGGLLRMTNASAVTTSGFATTVSAASGIEITSGAVTWNSVVSGTGVLTKLGTGTLTLGGTNSSYTGNVAVSAGVLAVSATGALSAQNNVNVAAGAGLSSSALGTGTLNIGALSGAGTITLGTSLVRTTVADGATTAFSGVIEATYTSGSVYGRFEKTGTGTLVIDGISMADQANGTGEFYVTSGSIAQTSGASAIAYLDVGTGAGGNGSLTLSGGSLTVKRTLSVGAWTGTGSVNQTGGTVFIPDPGDCTSCGGLYIGNQRGNGTYNISGGVLDFDGGTFNLGRSNAATSADFSGTLNISAAGEVVIHRGNLILGNWLVNASGGGTTAVGIGDGIINQTGGTLRVEADGKFYLAGRGDGTYNFSGGRLEIGGASLISSYNNAGGSQTFNLGGGTIAVTGSALVTDAKITLAPNSVSYIDTNALGATLNGAVTGTGILAKIGAGTLTLGNITAAGFIDLQEGNLASTGLSNTLGLLNVASGDTHTLTISSGRTLTLTSNNPNYVGGFIYGDSTLVLDGPGTLRVGVGSLLVGYPTGSGTLEPSGGTLVLDGASKLTLDSGVTTMLYVGVGSGVTGVTGALTQNGTSTVTIGSNMIVGGDGASATYTLNNSATLTTGPTANSFLYMGLNEGQRTAGTLGTLIVNDSAQVLLTAGYLHMSIATNGTNDYAGDSRFVQNGTSTVSFTNTHVAIGIDAGGTARYELNGGTLSINTVLALEIGSRTGANGVLAQTGGQINAGQSVIVGNNGTGAYTISGGTAAFSAGLVIANGANSSGTVTQTGGQVTVSGANLRFGAGIGSYALNGGILTVLSGLSGAGANDTLQFGGGTFKAGGSVTAANSFATTILADSTALFDTGTYITTWNSAIGGTGALSVSGTGTLILGGANTFTGAVSVTSGTLSLTNAAALSAANAVAVASGATLFIGNVPAAPSSAYQTVNIGALSGSGAINVGDNSLRTHIGEGQTSSFSGTLIADESSWESANFDNSLVKDGAGTLVIDGMSMTRGNLYGVAGTIAQTSGTTSLTYLAIGEQPGSTAILSITGGRLEIGEALQVGDWGGTGTVNQSGGVLSITGTCGNVLNCTSLNIGNQGGTGTYNLTGGELLLNGGTHSLGRASGSRPASTGTLNISGEALLQLSPGALDTGLLVIGDRDTSSGGANGTGTVNQTGGTLRVTGASELWLGGYGAGTYNLYGGTLEIGGASLRGLYGTSNTTGSYAFNLGGGTLKVIGAALVTSVDATLATPATGALSSISTLDTNGFDATLSGVVSGDGTLRKAGGGTLTLSGANSFTGGLVLDAGGLVLANAAALGTGVLTLSSSATVAVAGAYSIANAIVLAEGAIGTLGIGTNAVALSGAISGNGLLDVSGTGTLTLSGDNSYAGGTTVAGATLVAGSATAFGTGAIVLGASSALNSTGPLTLANAWTLGSGSVLSVGGPDLTLSGAISGAGGLSKTGAGTLLLSGSSSYSGATTVSAGVLSVAGTLSGTTVSVQSGGALTGSGTISNGVAVASGGTLAGTTGATLAVGSLVLDPGAIISANLTSPSTAALVQVAGALTLDGTLNVTSSTLLAGAYRLLSYGGALTDNGLDIGTLPGGIDAADILLAVGSGHVDLVNTAGATLQYWNGPAVLGPGTGSVQGGNGTWSVTNGNWTDATGAFNAPMQPQPGFAIFSGTAGIVTVDDTDGAVGATGMQFMVSGYSVTGDAIALSGTSAALRVGDGTSAGADMIATISSVLTGSAGIEKTDLGTLRLSGANTFTGQTLISGGTLALIGAGTLAASSGVVVDATFDITGATGGVTIASLSGNGAVLLGANDLTVGNGGIFSGVLSGTGGLTVDGGSLTLSGANTFTGGTTINSGATLVLLGSGALSTTGRVVADGAFDSAGASGTVSIASLAGAGSVTLGANGLTITNGTDTFSGTLGGAGQLVLTGGRQALTGTSTASGGTLLSGSGGATLVVANNLALGTGTLGFASSGTLEFADAISLAVPLSVTLGATATVDTAGFSATLSGAIEGGGDITKAGLGTLTIAGDASAHTGLLTVANGTLALGAGGALGAARLAIGDGATFDLSAASTDLSLASLSGTGAFVLGARTLTLGASNSSDTYAGVISGGGGLVKSGTGTLTLSGANTYSGTTQIDGGTLRAGAANALSTASAVTIASGGTLDLGGTTQTADSVALAGGTLTNGGLVGTTVTSTGGTITDVVSTSSLAVTSGVTTITGATSFDAGASISGGTLAVTGTLDATVFAEAGGTLTGTGTISEGVSIGAGGILAGATGTTLSMASLSLDSAAIISADLTSASATPLFAVAGALVLDGTLNITSSTLEIGVSRLFTYGGALTDNGLTFGTVPSGVDPASLTIIANSGRVDLVNAAGAVLQFWNGSATPGPGDGTISGGTGVWSTTNGNWTDATGSFNLAMQPQPGFAIFQGNAGEVTVDNTDGAVSVTGMQFAVSGYLVTGDAITLASASTVLRVGDGTAAGADMSAEIASALVGANGIEKTDLGTLILSGVNLYTGVTQVTGGTLALKGSGSIAESSGVAVEGVFDISQTTAGATIATLSGGGNVVLGDQTLTIANASTAFAGGISGTGGLAIAGGTLTLSGTSSFSGGVTLSGGGLTLESAGALGTGALTFAADGTLSLTSAMTLANMVEIAGGASGRIATDAAATLSGPVVGAGALVKSGAGMLTLSGNNTFTGGTVLEAGGLTLAHVSALGTGDLTVAADATVAFAVSGAIGNAVQLSGGALATFDTGSQTVSLTGAVSGAGALAKAGEGTLGLAAGNTYSGGTLLSGGTLALGGDGALGTGALTLAASAALLFDADQTVANAVTLGSGTKLTLDTASFAATLSGPIAGDGALATRGSGSLTFTGPNSYAGGTTLGGGSIILSDAAALGTGGVTVDADTRIVMMTASPFAYALSLSDGTLATFDTTFADVRLTGTTTGTGGIGVSGPGTFTFAGASLYTGQTHIFSGTAVADAAGALAAASAFTIDAGATLSLGNQNQTIGSLAGSGSVQLGAGTLTTGTDNTDTLFSGTITGTGGLTKVGTGNFTLAAPNLYSGDTRLSGGTLTVASDGAIGTGFLLMDGGTLAFTGSFTLANRVDLAGGGAFDTASGDVTLTGVIEGSGSLTKTGAGTLTLSGTNTFSGGIDVEGGTLAATTAAALGSGAVTFQGPSIFALPDSASGPVTNAIIAEQGLQLQAPASGNATLGGQISGAGGIVIGQGSITLAANNTYAGGTSVSGGASLVTAIANALPQTTTLAVASGGTVDLNGFSQSVGSLSGSGAVSLGGATLTTGALPGSTVFDGTLSGSGTLRKVGDGEMVFNGTATISQVNLESGRLIVGGAADAASASLNAPITVSGGVIGGHGTIGPLTMTGGALLPGNSIGTLTTLGNLTLASGSTLLIEVDATTSDRVNVIGAAALAGTLQVDTSAGWSANYAYTFLTATGGITGTFSDLVDDLPLANVEVDYGANSVTLTLVPSLVAFASLAATPNQATTADAVQSLGFGNPVFDSVMLLDAPQAQAAFNALSGGIYPSSANLFVLDSRFIRDATLARARTPLGTAPGAAATASNGAWAQAFGSWGTLDGTSNAPSLSRDIGGVFAGMDGRIGDTARIGFATGYSQTSLSVSALNSSGTSDDYYASLYFGATLGPIDLRGGAAFTWHDLSFSRSVIFPGFADMDQSDVSAHTGQIYGEIGIPWSMGPGALEPFLGAAYVRGTMDGFTEYGGAAALTASAQTANVVFTSLGLRGALDLLAGPMPVRARATLAWQHAFGDLDQSTTFSFASGSLPFAISGVGIPQDAFSLDAGIDLMMTSTARFGLSYAGLWGDGVTDNAFTASVQVRF